MKQVLCSLIVISGLVFSQLLWSQESPRDSEFQLDKGLVDRLYQESITETKTSTAQYSANITLSPVFSVFSPTQMTLSNNYFEIPYGEGIGSVPGISMVASGRIFNWGGLYIMGVGGVGYSMKETVQRATSKTASTNDRERTTRLTLHWLPLSLGSRMEYRFSGFEIIRPFVIVKGGAEWLYQVGQLDGIEQGFWIPYYQYGGGLTFFASTSSSPHSSGSWFGGLTLGVSKHQSFSSQQSVNGTVFDFAVNIVL